MRFAGSTAPGSGVGIFTGHFRSRKLSGLVMLASATLSRCERFGTSPAGSGPDSPFVAADVAAVDADLRALSDAGAEAPLSLRDAFAPATSPPAAGCWSVEGLELG